MKSLVEILTEGNIGDLKGVRYIRHYTTLNGLASILKDGYIKAQRSDGDDDWRHYGIKEYNVVSFHDARTDPELEGILNSNDENTYIDYSETLALHMLEICCFIEYNFDLLPDKIKEKADFIRILERYVDRFCLKWNVLCGAKEYLGNKVKDIKTYEDFVEALEDYEYQIFKMQAEAYNRFADTSKDLVSILKRKLKPYTKAEEQQLLQAAIADDGKTVISIMKKHGYKPGDENNMFLYPYYSADDGHDGLITYVSKRFLKTDDYQIEREIRIACDMPINIKGCTIYFFKGVADAVYKDNSFKGNYDELLDKLESMSNVEIYEPGDDYSLIN